MGDAEPDTTAVRVNVGVLPIPTSVLWLPRYQLPLPRVV